MEEVKSMSYLEQLLKAHERDLFKLDMEQSSINRKMDEIRKARNEVLDRLSELETTEKVKIEYIQPPPPRPTQIKSVKDTLMYFSAEHDSWIAVPPNPFPGHSSMTFSPEEGWKCNDD